jgi:hypothetical protein
MNQQQLVQMQADMPGFQAQLAAANALATQAQVAAQQAQADNVVQVALIAQQRIDLVAAQALAARCSGSDSWGSASGSSSNATCGCTTHHRC